MAKLAIMCGLPRSGKTTQAQRLEREGWVRVCPDDIRLALHLDTLTLVIRLHLLSLCRLAVRLAQHRCPPPLLAGPGGRPRRYRDESLLLLALLRTLWRLSYQDLPERALIHSHDRSRLW